MRILVTGGAGYIGSITTRLLVEAGHQCVVVDNLARGNREAVDSRVRFVEADVADANLLGILEECDAVVHFAGLIDVAESEREPELYFEVNTRRATIFLENCERAGIDKFVFSSTAAVYGEPETVPIRESDRLAPVNPYGESKLAYEQALLDYAERGVASIRLRYFNVAGAWPDGSLGEAHPVETHIIPRVLMAMRDGQREFEVFGGDYPTPDGTCVRDYIHVVDLAQAHLLALEHLDAGGDGGAFNLGNGQGFSNLEVVHACAEVTGSAVDVRIGARRPGDPAQLVASSERARNILNWVPTRPEIETIVADAWRWHLAHPNGYR